MIITYFTCAQEIKQCRIYNEMNLQLSRWSWDKNLIIYLEINKKRKIMTSPPSTTGQTAFLLTPTVYLLDCKHKWGARQRSFMTNTRSLHTVCRHDEHLSSAWSETWTIGLQHLRGRENGGVVGNILAHVCRLKKMDQILLQYFQTWAMQ